MDTDIRVDTVLDQRRILSFSMLFLIFFLVVAYIKESFNPVNLSINLWSASVNNGFFTLTAKIISVIFDTTILVVLSVVLAILLFVLHYKSYGLLLLCAMGGDALLVTFFKIVIMSPRPLNGIIVETGYSFPSGHTTSCVVFLGLLTYFVWRQWGTFKIRALTSGFYLSITTIVAFDRIYLNVHWFSDIIGSVFLGAFWLTLSIFLFKHFSKSKNLREHDFQTYVAI